MDDDGVIAGAQEDVGCNRMYLAIKPGVDDHDVVNPDTHAVIGGSCEAVGAGWQVGCLCPLGGKIVDSDFRAWRTSTPVEVNAGVLAGQGRVAGKVTVIPVFPFPGTALCA